MAKMPQGTATLSGQPALTTWPRQPPAGPAFQAKYFLFLVFFFFETTSHKIQAGIRLDLVTNGDLEHSLWAAGDQVQTLLTEPGLQTHHTGVSECGCKSVNGGTPPLHAWCS